MTERPTHSVISPRRSLVLRFVKDQFDDYRESTIGGELDTSAISTPSSAVADIVPLPLCNSAAFLTQTLKLDEQTTIKFEIW